MWIAMCRYYAIVGEFAGEVLKKHYLTGNTHLDFEDYDRFIADKATWHSELETVSEGTAKKLRSDLFKAMGRHICSIKIPTWCCLSFPVPLWRIFLERGRIRSGIFRCANRRYEQNGG